MLLTLPSWSSIGAKKCSFSRKLTFAISHLQIPKGYCSFSSGLSFHGKKLCCSSWLCLIFAHHFERCVNHRKVTKMWSFCNLLYFYCKLPILEPPNVHIPLTVVLSFCGQIFVALKAIEIVITKLSFVVTM